MISIFILILLSFFVGIINAGGQFVVLHSPRSIIFSGEELLESTYVGDVLLAALGNSVAGPNNWSGMFIRDPFNLFRTTLIVVHVRGVLELPTPKRSRKYILTDFDSETSLDYLITQQEFSKAIDINFVNHLDGVEAFNAHFGVSKAVMPEPIKFLHPEAYLSHQHFLEELGLIHYAADNLSAIVKPSNVIVIRLSLDRVAKASRFATIDEAKTLIAGAMEHLVNAVRKQTEPVLLVQITSKKMSHEWHMAKQSVVMKASNIPFQKVTMNKQYPSLLNIVTWLTIILVLALAAICYALATIDPARDSIIYRISSTHSLCKTK